MANSKLAVNPKSTAKKKPRGKPFTGKDDPRNNLLGAPKRGFSWAELIKEYGDMTAPEVAARSLEMAKQFIKLSDDGLTLKEAVVIRVFGSLLFEPQPGLLNAFMERVEGKITQPFSVEEKEIDNTIESELARVAASRKATAISETQDAGNGGE